MAILTCYDVNGQISTKSYNLAMLAQTYLTGLEPSKAETCQAALKVVLDSVNQRHDILPDYHLELAIRDEGRGSTLGPRALTTFLREFEQARSKDPNLFLSPVIYGPTSACNLQSTLTKSLNMVHFSTSCASPNLVSNRKLYSNLYRVRIAGVFTSHAIFITKVGQWSQIGVLGSFVNSNDLITSLQTQEVLTKNGIDIVYFDARPDFTLEMLERAKNSKARVFLISSSSTSSCALFQCLSHKVGMTSPQYVFFTSFLCNVQPEIPNPNCGRDVLEAQAKITFYVGPPPFPVFPPNQPTVLGFTPLSFDEAVNRELSFTRFPDFEQRLPCHDAFLASVLTLNLTENILKREHNRTLRDYDKEPDLVGQVVNRAAAAINMIGLRIPRLIYSKRTEVDTEELAIGQRFSGGNVAIYFRVVALNPDDIDPENASSFQVIPVERSGWNNIWTTKNKKPPKDLSKILDIYEEFPLEHFSTILAMSGSSLAFQIGLLAATVKLLPKTKASKVFFDIDGNLIAISGCILLNISSIVFATSCFQVNSDGFSAAIAFAVIGVGNLNGHLVFRCYTLAAVFDLLEKFNRAMLKSVGYRSSFKRLPLPVGTALIVRGALKRTRWSTIFLTLVTLIIAFVWLVVLDPIIFAKNVSPVSFSLDLDSYYQVTSVHLTSLFLSYWVGSVVVLHGFLLLAGLICVVESKRHKIPSMYWLDIKTLQISVTNACTVFIAVLVVFFAVETRDQAIVLSLGLSFYSTSVSAILFYPVVNKKWPIT